MLVLAVRRSPSRSEILLKVSDRWEHYRVKDYSGKLTKHKQAGFINQISTLLSACVRVCLCVFEQGLVLCSLHGKREENREAVRSEVYEEKTPRSQQPGE